MGISLQEVRWLLKAVSEGLQRLRVDTCRLAPAIHPPPMLTRRTLNRQNFSRAFSWPHFGHLLSAVPDRSE